LVEERAEATELGPWLSVGPCRLPQDGSENLWRGD
jgi:hypothetical protein